MPESTCPVCGTARTGSFRFCRSCGFDFDTIPSGAMAPPEPNVLREMATPDVLGTGGARRSRSGFSGVAIIVGIALGLIAVVGGVGLVAINVFLQHHDIPARLTVVDSGSSSKLRISGSTCRSAPGEPDIGPSTIVSVADPDGNVLATTTLGTGTVSGTACQFAFTLRGVPEVSSYVFKIDGLRLADTFSLEFFQSHGWNTAFAADLGQPADDLSG
jgi:hypothetical protein